MVKLVENEILKTLAKKRLHVIIGILIALIALFAYGEHYTLSRTQERVSEQMGIEYAEDWQAFIRQQLADIERRLENPYIPDQGKASLRVQAEQLQFYLDREINPINSSASKFMGRFIEQSAFLFLPLLIILLASDMVSGEVNTGTIKMLLTRPVPRWKILLSKWFALLILEMMVILSIAFIAFVIAWITFGFIGMTEPVMTGFKIVGDTLDTSQVKTIPQWQYLVMIYALGYYIAVIIGSLALAVSVFVKSTSASIGIMMASLIGGSFLSFFISEWEITKYLYTVNLNLIAYISGSFQSFDGLSLPFSLIVLAGWGLISMFLAFYHFTQKDILA